MAKEITEIWNHRHLCNCRGSLAGRRCMSRMNQVIGIIIRGKSRHHINTDGGQCFLGGNYLQKKVEHRHLHPSEVINWSILSFVLKVFGIRISNVEIVERYGRQLREIIIPVGHDQYPFCGAFICSHSNCEAWPCYCTRQPCTVLLSPIQLLLQIHHYYSRVPNYCTLVQIR